MKTLKTITNYMLNALGIVVIIILSFYLEDAGKYYREHNELARIKYLEDVYYNQIPDDEFEDLLLRIPEEYSDNPRYIAQQWLDDQK